MDDKHDNPHSGSDEDTSARQQIGLAKKRSQTVKETPYEIQVFDSGSLETESEIKWNECTKNPGHHKFITASAFTKDDLPIEYQTDDWLQYVKLASALTVRLRVNGISPDRPKHGPLSFSSIGGTHAGIGFIISKMDPSLYSITYAENECDGQKCWRLAITTASHVVFDDYEAKLTAVDLFYDDEDSRAGGRMKTVHGVSLFATAIKYDSGLFYVMVHDEDLVRQINETWDEIRRLGEKLKLNMKTYSNLEDPFHRPPSPAAAVIISHPHARPKKITVGEVKLQSLLGPEIEFLSHSWAWVGCKYSMDTCPGSSGANIFFLGGWRVKWSLGLWVGLHCKWDEFEGLNSGVLLCSRSVE